MIEHQQTTDNAIHVELIAQSALDNWLKTQSKADQRWLETNQFGAAKHTVCLPDSNGDIAKVVVCINKTAGLWRLGDVAKQLPAGQYTLINHESFPNPELGPLAWCLGSYCMDRYKSDRKDRDLPTLLMTDSDAHTHCSQLVDIINQVRELINLPTNDLGPDALDNAIKALAIQHEAVHHSWVGDDLLTENFPAVHAVGRASTNPPRLCTLTWGDADHPLVALVGKGVCFDTGGLNIKPLNGMLTMKKDMGGSAHAIGLANMIMTFNLPVRLLLVVPAVENNIDGNAYRPGDVISTRKGKTIEVMNTDAEGRVILADALAYADEHNPDVIIDFATLTGAARVALGPDLPALFTRDIQTSRDIQDIGIEVDDPVWPLPVYQPYQPLIKAALGDIRNTGSTVYGGAITAALFLDHFVSEDRDWVHFDIMASNTRSLPGKPEGGEAMGLRAMYQWLTNRYTTE